MIEPWKTPGTGGCRNRLPLPGDRKCLTVVSLVLGVAVLLLQTIFPEFIAQHAFIQTKQPGCLRLVEGSLS